MFELKNISKIYSQGILGKKKQIAVDRVSFSVPQGQIFSLIGESGSGKTTIGKLMLKLIQPTSGKIYYNRNNITHLQQKLKKQFYQKVQGIFQDPFSSFNPIFKVDRIFNIIRSEFFPHIDNSSWNDSVNMHLYKVGLNHRDVRNKFIHQLSGGQLQRFLIARALLLNAKFLVADEIISMLDASTRIDVLNLLISLKEKGLSILFITHDLNLAYYISDSVLIMYNGSIIEMGHTKEVYNTPLHPYTKMLLESIPRIDKKWECREIHRGDFRNQSSGSYCKFFNRCIQQNEHCQNVDLIKVSEYHSVACAQCQS